MAGPAVQTSSRWGVLLLGIVAVSTGSILARLAQAPALVIGAWRLSLAALLLTPAALARSRREWRSLDGRDMLRLVLSGLALAVHFATWLASLSYTTVASSVILVSTNPIFVGLASHFLLGEHLRRGTIVAIGVVMIGTVIVSYGDLSISGRALWGDLLALLGAVAASSYFLLGRALRRKLSTLAYVWPCYGIAGLALLLMCLLAGQPLIGYTGPTYVTFLLMAVVPQVLGHSGFKSVLRVFTSTFVTLAILGEPVGATILALLVLSEAPRPTALIGGALVLAGIYLASRQERPRSAPLGTPNFEEERTHDRRMGGQIRPSTGMDDHLGDPGHL